MEFGITCARVDDVGLVKHAENLGYDFCWATDSPMLRSNPFVVLALAAQQTRTIRLGLGVAVPGLRLAPELANGIASINTLAPGRTFLGIGTGNTAMRTLGRVPMRVKPFGRYIRQVKGLLDGEEIQLPVSSDEGADPAHTTTHAVRFQNPSLRYVNLDDPIPIHVGGFGPRAQALAGELGDGLITGIPRGGTVDQALTNVHRGAARTGRDLRHFKTTALVNLMMLEPGETLSSARVIAECGPAIMANVHYLVDLARETGASPPDYVLPIWEEYLAFHRRRDAAHSHQKLHESHYSYLDPEEARFVTPEMIKTFCIAGQPEEIVEQLQSLQQAGLDAISFIAPDELKYRLHEDFARRVISRMRGL
ncbi:MAG: LLM class flavin-dependent oxidoreductase [Gammaproteobacteria bacterium]|nr:LLM class flavin-dependent oxidoreductase [Gammaproteobacteria bacterium]